MEEVCEYADMPKLSSMERWARGNPGIEAVQLYTDMRRKEKLFRLTSENFSADCRLD